MTTAAISIPAGSPIGGVWRRRGTSRPLVPPAPDVIALAGRADKLEIFTTRPDTLFGASFMAIAADHPLAGELAAKDPKLAAFVAECRKTATTAEALETAEKKGYRTNLEAIHPFDASWTLPVYVANFVLMEYGTGAIFGCPAHDQRDLEFARKYGLPVKPVVIPPGADPESFTIGDNANVAMDLEAALSDGGASAGLIKAGSGFCSVQGSNSYSGATTIAEGTVGIGNANSLGASGGGTIISNGATLRIAGNLTINENAGLQTVNLSGISSGASNEIQSLTVTASSSSTLLIPNPAGSIEASGKYAVSLSFNSLAFSSRIIRTATIRATGLFFSSIVNISSA